MQFLLKSTEISHMAPGAGTTHQQSVKAQAMVLKGLNSTMAK